MPIVLVELFAVLGPWIMRFLAVKGVIMAAGFLGRIGIVLMTSEMVVKPLLEAAKNAWSAFPAEYSCWLNTFGVLQMASIMISGLTLIVGKRVFFGKSS